MKTIRLRPGIAMIELIFAIVIMGIAFLSAPMLIATASNSSQVTFQQEAIAMIASHTNALMSYAWDEKDMVSNHTILRTFSTNIALRNRINGLVSKGRIWDRLLAVGASNPGNFGVPDGSETVEDDVDDFHNQDTQLSTIDAASTVIDGDYLDKTASINTKVQYASDSSSSADFSTCQNSGNGCAYSNPTVGVGNSTNVKFITTTLTSSNVQDRNIRLRAFMCNIGSVVPQKRMGI